MADATEGVGDTLERAFRVVRTIVEVCEGKSEEEQNDILLTIRDILEDHAYRIGKLKSTVESIY